MTKLGDDYSTPMLSFDVYIDYSNGNMEWGVFEFSTEFGTE